MVSFSTGLRRNGDIRENALFTIAKREIPMGFLLLDVYSHHRNIGNSLRATTSRIHPTIKTIYPL